MAFGNNQKPEYGKCKYEIGVYVDGALERVLGTGTLDGVPVLLSQINRQRKPGIEVTLKSPSEEIFQNFGEVEPLNGTKWKKNQISII